MAEVLVVLRVASDPKYDAPNLVPSVWSDDHPDDLVVRVVTVMETVSEGGVTFRVLNSNDCQAWQAMGLIHAATVYYEMMLAGDFNDPEQTDDP